MRSPAPRRRSTPTLDAYATAWTAMHTEACKATRVRGDQSEAVLTLRMACLDNRLAELGAMVRLFAAGDEPIVLGAVAAAQKLSPIAECADTAALLAPDPLPKDPAARDAVVKLQAKLAEARALKNASRLEDVLAITSAIAPDVQRLGHKPTEAELHLLAGEVLWGLDGADRGEAELLQAVYAAEAGKADETKVEAWLALTNLAASQTKFAVATDRWQQTSAALARLGTSWNLQVRLLASKALIASRQNDYDTAIASAKQARELAEQHADAPTRSYALLVEASILNATAHPQDAIGDFAKILAYEDSLGHRRVEVAVVLQNMATAELQLGKFADAIEHTRASLVIEEAIYGADSSEVARALGTLGAAQSMNGDYAGALATEQHALDQTGRTVGTDSDQYGQLLGQIADTLVHLDRPRDAIDYLDRGIAIQTAKLGAGHVQTLTIVLTKCDALHASGDDTAAIAVCEQALATAESTLGKNNPILFVFLGHLGEILLDAGKPEKAGATLDRALKLGATDPSDMYFIALLDARAQWDLGNRARAIELATQARDGFASLGAAKADQAKDAAQWLAAHATK
jgi:hypothetical protein